MSRSFCFSRRALVLLIAAHLAYAPAHAFGTAIPADCPIPRSTDIASVTITDLHRTYDGAADTWYPVWAGDGTAYSPFMDGLGASGNVTKMGFALITGDDPLQLVVKKTSLIDETTALTTQPTPGPFARYACTLLPYKGVLYYGSSYRMIADDCHFLRPFAGFNLSTDGGTTWTKRAGPLFPEADYPGIKIGEPHFVDFGPELKNSPDGKAYLVAFGANPQLAAARPKQVAGTKVVYENPNWNWGDSIYLLRVTPTPATINDPASYEYYAGKDPAGKPVWTRDFAKIAPIVEWPDHMGQVTATYVPALRKYLMCVTNGAKYAGPFDTCILESGDLTGPWRIVSDWNAFGAQAYFVHFPSKFLGTEVKDNTLTAWLVYSANFTGQNASDPPDSKYAMCVRQVQIKLAPKTK